MPLSPTSTDDASIRQIAERVGMSPSHVSAIIRRFRLRLAARILTDPESTPVSRRYAAATMAECLPESNPESHTP